MKLKETQQKVREGFFLLGRPQSALTIKNPEIEQKLAKLQKEVEKALSEQEGHTIEVGISAVPRSKIENDTDKEYWMSYNSQYQYFVPKKLPKKHVSPTKRLMQQKNAAFKQKPYMAEKVGNNFKQKYGITYQVGVNTTYHMQPKHGEINYELANSKPSKFYRQVVDQDVREHKVSPRK